MATSADAGVLTFEIFKSPSGFGMSLSDECVVLKFVNAPNNMPGPAQRAGVKEGMVVHSINGVQVTDRAGVSGALRFSQDQVSFGFRGRQWATQIIESHHDTVKNFVEYEVQVKLLDKCWEVRHRYSSFRKLRDSILVDASAGTKLPPFPGRKVFGNTEPAFVSTRLKELSEFLHTLVQVASVRESHHLVAFLAPTKAVKVVTALAHNLADDDSATSPPPRMPPGGEASSASTPAHATAAAAPEPDADAATTMAPDSKKNDRSKLGWDQLAYSDPVVAEKMKAAQAKERAQAKDEATKRAVQFAEPRKSPSAQAKRDKAKPVSKVLKPAAGGDSASQWLWL